MALTEACLAVQESLLPDYDAAGVVRGPSGTRLEGIAPSNLYRTSDDMWIVIAANQDTVFRRLCAAMDQPGLADDPRFADHLARGVNQDELDALIGEWAAKWTLDDLLAHLSEAGVVAGPVNTVAEVVADPQFLARGMIVPHHDERTGSDVLGPGVVPVLDATPGSVRRAGAPVAGYDNAAVYGEILGLSEAEREDLRGRGVI